MATPIKLKRNQEAFRSTQPRTATPAPTLSLPYPPPQLPRPALRPPIAHSLSPHPLSREDTSHLLASVSRNINEDSDCSQRTSQRVYKGHYYNLRSPRGRLSKAGPLDFPRQVAEARAEAGQEGEVAQGCLQRSGIYYFAVGRRVLLYDLSMAMRCVRRLEEVLLRQCDFEEPVFELKEVDWRTPLVQQFANKSLVAVVQPTQVAFVILEIEPLTAQLTHAVRWTRVTPLHFYCDVAAGRIDHLTAAGQHLLFLNEQGTLCHFATEEAGWCDKVFKGKQYSLARHEKGAGLTSSHFYVSRKTTLFNKLKHFGRVVATEAKNVFRRRAKNYGLVYDHKRQLVFTLVDNQPRDGHDLSHSKILTCWSYKQGQLREKCRMSEVELYCSELEQLASENANGNSRIAQILEVDQTFYPECSLLIVLHCGLRLYVKVRESFQVVSFHFLRGKSHEHHRTSSREFEYTRPTQLLHCFSSGSTFLITTKEASQQQTSLVWKKNEDKEDEMLTEVVWSGSIKEPDRGKCPTRSKIWKCLAETIYTQKWQMVAAELTGQHFLSRHELTLHQILKDMYSQPQIYVHSTDLYLEYFYFLRPVDILFSTLVVGITDEVLIHKILCEFTKTELHLLFIQILCDREGLYVRDLDFLQVLTAFANRVPRNGVDDYVFEDFVKEFERKLIDPFQPRAERPRTGGATLQNRDVIDKKVEDNIIELMFKLTENEFKKTSKNPVKDLQTLQEDLYSSILVYASRLLRFIWNKKLSSITRKSVCLIEQLEQLKDLVVRIDKYQYLSESRLVKKSKETKKTLNRMLAVDSETSSLDGKETEKECDGAKMRQMRKFLDKIQQLLIMSNKIQFRIQRTFETALGLDSTQYQQAIFQHLIQTYDSPTRTLEAYQKIFPLFIGKNIEKALKIYSEIKHHEMEGILTTLRYHKNIPNYLLDYIVSSKQIRKSELSEFYKEGDFSKIMLPNKNSPKETIKTLLQNLQEKNLPLDKRTALICTLNAQMLIYLDMNGKREDSYYVAARRRINEMEKIVNMQTLLLKMYQAEGETYQDSTVVHQLDRSILSKQELKESIELLAIKRVQIIYFFIFEDCYNEDVREQISSYFVELFKEELKAGTGVLEKWSEKLAFWREKPAVRQKWGSIQSALKDIMAYCKKYIDVDELMELMINCCTHEEIIRLMGNDKIREAISQLKFNESTNKFAMKEWLQSIDIPVLSLFFIQVGIATSDVERYLSIWLQKIIEKAQNLGLEDRNIILYVWLCYFCLIQSAGLDASNFLTRSNTLLQKLKRHRLIEDTQEAMTSILENLKKQRKSFPKSIEKYLEL